MPDSSSAWATMRAVGYCRGLIPGDGVFGRREHRLDCPFADLGPAQQRLYGLTSYVAPAREVLCISGVGASRQPGVGNRERRDLVQAIDEFTDRCVPSVGDLVRPVGFGRLGRLCVASLEASGVSH